MLKPKIKPLLLVWLNRLRTAILRFRQKTGTDQQLKHFRQSVVRSLFLLIALTGVFLYTRAGTPARVEAATPNTLNFQARLLTNSGAIAPDGVYNVEFKLYDDPSAGSLLWTETRLTSDAANLQVQVRDGYVSVYLGDKTALTGINWDQQLYLTMNIGGTGGSPSWDGEMNPRLRLTSVPYAIQAQRAESFAKTVTGNLAQVLFPGSLGQATNYNFIDPGQANVDICLSTGNCAGAGGGITGSGTPNRLAYFDTNGSIADSVLLQGTGSLTLDTGTDLIVDDGDLTVNGAINVQNYIDFEGAAAPGPAASGFGRLYFDSSDNVFKVQQSGDSNFYDICTTGGNCAGSGSGVTASGTTAGYIPVLTGTQQLGNSALFQDTPNTVIEVANGYDVSLLGGNLIVDGDGSFTGNLGVDGDLTVGGNTTLGDANTDTLTITGTAVTTPNGLNFDANTLIIDAANNRVGIGISGTAADLLSIGGTTGNFRIDTNGAIKAATGLTTSGSVQFSSLTSNGLLKTTSGNGTIAVATAGTDYEVPLTFANGLTRSSNAISLGGNLTANTTLTLNGQTLSVTGSGGSTVFNADGTVTIGATGVALNVTNDANIGGTLTTDALDVTTTATIGGDLIVNVDNLVVDTTNGFVGIGTASPTVALDVVGDGNFSGALTSDSLTVTSDAGIGGNLTVTGTVSVTGTSNFVGAVTLGNDDAVTPIQGQLIFHDSDAANGFALTLQTEASLSDNITVTFPNPSSGTTGIVCYQGDTACGFLSSGSGSGFVSLAPASAQADNSNNSSIFINKGALNTGNLIQLQSNSTDKFVVDYQGNTTVAGTFGVTGAATFTGLSTFNGGVTIETGDTFTMNGDAFTDLTGSGLVFNSGALTVDASSATGFFRNGGNSFNTTAVLGTNDNNDLQIRTNGNTRATFAANGDITLAGNTSVSGSNTLTVGGLTTLNGGLTAVGTVNINNTGSAATNVGTGTGNTTVGNTTGTLTLQGSTVVLGTATVTRTAAGTTTFDFVDGSNTTLAITNSGAGNANLTVDGTITAAQGLIVSSGGANITGTLAVTGNQTFTSGANRSISIGQETGTNAGDQLSISAGQGGGTGSGAAGGTLALNGGTAAGSGNNNGGNVTINGGAKTGSGTVGNVILQGTVTIDAAGGITGATSLSSSGNIDFASLSAGGLVKAASGTGRLSVATAGTDYEVPLTFTNGLTRSTNTISLGGNLANDTTLGLNGHSFTFDGSTGDVAIAATGTATFGNGITVSAGGADITGTVTINTTGSAATNIGTGSATGNVGIGNTTGTVTLTGASVLLNTPTISRTAAGTTTVDLVDGANTTFALTNSGSGVANFTTDGSITAAGNVQGTIVNATTGFRINGTAVLGNYLRGDGTNFVSSGLLAADLSGTIFNTAGDTGTGTLTTGETITVNGSSNGIDVALSGDTFAVSLDTSEIASTTFGSGSGFTWTFDAGATDPQLSFASDAVTITAATTNFSGNLAVNGGSATFGGSGQAGTIVLYDGGSGGSANTLTLNVAATLGQNSTITFPDPGAGGTGTVCYQNSASCGFALASGNNYVFFTPSTAQVDNAAEASIFINDTGGGNLLQLQSGGSDVFVISSAGIVTAGTWNGTAIGAQYGGTGINTSASTGVPTISSGTWSVSAQLPVSLGGTGAATLTSNGVLLGNGTSAVTAVTGTSGQVLIANGSGVPTFATFSGDVTVSNTGVTTIQANSVALGTDTTGNYVGDVAAGGLGLAVSGTPGEGYTETVSFDYAASLAGNPALGSGESLFGDIGVIFEGSTANNFETLLTVTDPTADRTITLPNVNGTVITTGNLTDITAVGTVASGTWQGTAIGATYGGTGIDTSGSTGVPTISSGNWTVQAQLPVSLGGTGAATLTQNGVILGNGTNALSAVTGTSAQVLVVNGSGVPTFVSLSGDVAISNTGVATIQPNSVALGTDTTGNFVDNVDAGLGLAVSGTPGEGFTETVNFDYTATLAGNPTLNNGESLFGSTGVIFEGSTANNFETLLTVTDPTADNTITLPNVSGTVITSGNLTDITAVGTVASGTWQGTAIGAQYGGTGISTTSSTGVPTISSGTWSVQAQLPVSLGGTGAATLTQNGVILGNGTNALSAVTGTSAQVLIANGSGVPTFVSLSGDVTVSNTGVTTIGANSVALGTDTTGNYVGDVAAGGLGIDVSGTAGEGFTETVSFDYGASLAGNPALNGGESLFGDVGVIFEGSTANNFETLLTVADPTADNTITLPNVTGTVITTGNLTQITAVGTISSGTWQGTAIGAQYGGTGINTSTSTGVPTISSGSWTVQAQLPVSLGGTGRGTLTAQGLLVGDGTNDVVSVTGTSAQILVVDASGDPDFVTMSGDVTVSSTGVTTIGANTVALGTDTTGNYVGDVNAGTGIAVTGTAGENWTPVVSLDYAATLASNTLTANQSSFASTGLIFEGASANGFETLVTASDPTQDNTITLPDVSGTVITTGNLTQITAVGTIASGTWQGTAVGSQYGGTGQNFSSSTGVPTINSGAWSVQAQLSVSLGGTGAATLAQNGIIMGNDTSPLSAITGTSAQILVVDGSGVPDFVDMTGDVTVSNTGVTTIGVNSVALGTDTTGNYVASVAAGAGLAVTGSAGEGWTPTVALDYSATLATNTLVADQTAFSPTGLIFEGATANGFETLFTAADPTADNTITLPNASGAIVLNTSGSSITGVTGFVQGGNDFGTTTAGILGTTNNGDLNIVTNGNTRLVVEADGDINLANNTLFVDIAARSGSGGNLVKIGNSTGTDGATTILQVDSATADPTSNLAALNGGLFYNSTDKLIKAILDGAVDEFCFKTSANCSGGSGGVGGSGTADQVAFFDGLGSTVTGDADFTFDGSTITTNAVLNLNTSGTGAISIGTGTFSSSIDIGNNASTTTILGAVNINDSGAATTNIGYTSGTGAVNIGNNTGNLTLQGNTTSISSQGTFNIGTNAVAQTITVGNSTGATSVSLNAGNGGVNIGTNGVANTIQIGNTSGAVTQNIQIGTNNTGGSTSNVTIGSTVAGNITLQSAATINIGNNAAAQTLNIGNTSGATALNLYTGTGNFSLDGVGATNYVLGASTTTGAITLGGANQTGTLTLGQSTDSNTINVGNGTIANTKTETVNIATQATGTGKTIVNIGSTNDASAVTLQAGTGNINFNAAVAQFTEDGSPRTLTVETRSSNANGTGLTISAGNAGAGGSSVTGGDLTLQGGAAAGSDANGGNVFVQGGAGTGSSGPGVVALQASGGYVGVGTSTPQRVLDVNGSSRILGSGQGTLTGSIDPDGTTSVTGVGTKFLSQLLVGDQILVSSETRTVVAIASDTSLTVDEAFSDTANDTSPKRLAAQLIVTNSTNSADFIVQDNGNVGIGTAAPTNTLTVDGTANITGHLAVGDGATVDGDIFNLSNYSSVLTVAETFTDLSNNTNGINNSVILNPSSDSSGTMSGILNSLVIDPTNNTNFSGLYYGAQNQFVNRGTGTVSSGYGAQDLAINASTGSVTNLMGANVGAWNAGGGSVTTATGLRVSVSQSNAGSSIGTALGIDIVAASTTGTITNNYGLRIAAQTAGSSKVGLAIGEASGGNNTNLLIGTTTIPSGSYSIYNSSTDANLFGGQLIFSGVATDITTATNEDLTVVANGTGDVYIDSGSDTVNVGTNTTTAVVLGNAANNSTVTINTGNGAINIGDTTGTKATDIGGNDNNATDTIRIATNATSADAITIGSINSGSTLTLEAGTAASAIQIGNGTTAHGIQIGTSSSAAQAIIMGSTNASSTTLIQGGTGASAISLQTGAGGTVSIGASAGSGTTFLNNGSTLNATLAVADDANGGVLGGGLTAGQSVDIYTSFAVTQTTAGQTITIPSPTNTAAGRIIYVANTSTNSTSFTLLGATVNAGSTATLFWNGTAWTFAGADGSSILNQNTADQTANFRISGVGRANGGLLAPSLDVVSGGLAIGGGTTTGSAVATSITVGVADSVNTVGVASGIAIKTGKSSGNNNTGSITLQTGDESTGSSNSSGAITIKTGDATSGNNSSGNISIDVGSKSGSGTTGAITIGTTNASAVTIGNSSSTTTLQAGAGNIVFGAAQAQFSEVTGTRTLTVQTRTTNVAGTALTISGGTAGSGASAFTGGKLTLQGGNAGGTGNANGANVLLTGGTGVGTGVSGIVEIDTPVFTASATQTFDGVVPNTISQSVVDGNSTIPVNATAGSLTITLPAPTITTVGRIIYVTSVNGSNTFTISPSGGTAFVMNPNMTGTFVWNGAGWTNAGVDGGSASYIQNQTSTSQVANFRINGTGQAANFDINTSGTLGIGTGTTSGQVATGITIGNTANNPTFTINTGTGNVNISDNAGTKSIDIGGNDADGADTVRIATGGTSADTVTVGSNNSASTVKLQGGAAANLNVRNTGIGINTGSSTVTGDLSFGNGSTRTINLIQASSGTGNDLNIQAGQGASGQLGGNLILQAGANGTASGTTGSVIVRGNGSGNSTTAFLIQKGDASTNLFTADTTNMVLYVGNSVSSTRTLSGTGNLVVKDSIELLASGVLRIGDGTNAITFNDTVITGGAAGKLRFSGSARNSIALTLSPEFPGATLFGTGTGTMTSDFCSGSAKLNTNTSVCSVSSDEHNYYSWTANASNSYSIYTKWKVPSNFSAFDSTPAQFYGWSTNTNHTIVLTFYKNGTSCGTQTVTTSSGWALSSSISMAGCTINANDELILKADLVIGTGGVINTNFVRMGEILINYLAAF